MTVVDVARTLKFGVDNAVRLTLNNARTPEILAGKMARQIEADSTALIGALRSEELIKELGFNSAEAMFSIFLPNTYEVYSDIAPEALIRRLKRESDNYWGGMSLQDRLTVNDRKINKIIAQMTLEEKVEMLHSKTNMSSEGVPRLGIQDIKYTDGPFGIREENGDGFRSLGWTLDSATFR